jgi:hypothetical protein
MGILDRIEREQRERERARQRQDEEAARVYAEKCVEKVCKRLGARPGTCERLQIVAFARKVGGEVVIKEDGCEWSLLEAIERAEGRNLRDEKRLAEAEQRLPVPTPPPKLPGEMHGAELEEAVMRQNGWKPPTPPPPPAEPLWSPPEQTEPPPMPKPPAGGWASLSNLDLQNAVVDEAQRMAR